jgi:hypothetical protein
MDREAFPGVPASALAEVTLQVVSLARSGRLGAMDARGGPSHLVLADKGSPYRVHHIMRSWATSTYPKLQSQGSDM